MFCRNIYKFLSAYTASRTKILYSSYLIMYFYLTALRGTLLALEGAKRLLCVQKFVAGQRFADTNFGTDARIPLDWLIV
jgi:hypothetical protein